MLSPGVVINDRYELVEQLGSGGMGEVWMATDKRLTRHVAIKVVHPHLLHSDPSTIKILLDEARLGARILGHPNVVGTLDFVECTLSGQNTRAIIMEYVDGVTMQKWIVDHCPHADRQSAYYVNLLVALQTCSAIQYAHKHGVQHRDVKPLNVFLDKEKGIKVGDYGIARFIDAATRTHTMQDAMSPAYAAPEQWRGEKHTNATDVYQLSCTLYQLFAGVLPFSPSSKYALMNMHLNDMPADPIVHNPTMDATVAKIILSGLSKIPKDRPPLWKIYDAISAMVTKNFTLIFNLSGLSDPMIEKAFQITELKRDALKKPGSHLPYSDYREALSEAMELIINGITQFTIKRT
jgi:serine/threonine-protein kinase